MSLEVAEALRLAGRLRLCVWPEGFDPLPVYRAMLRDSMTGDRSAALERWCPPVDMREVGNIACTAGLGWLASAIMWSGVEDQAAAQGNPFAPITAAPIYGAVGDGTTTPTSGDAALASELGRAVVAAESFSAATWTWVFFFGVTAAAWTISEAGVFLNATETAGDGKLLDRALISPSVAKPAASTATLQVTFALTP
jgi:hypothetical protein